MSRATRRKLAVLIAHTKARVYIRFFAAFIALVFCAFQGIALWKGAEFDAASFGTGIASIITILFGGS